MLTMSYDLEKVRSVSATDTSFASKISTRTEPTGDAATATGASIIDIRRSPGEMSSEILLVPYGLGDDDDVFAMRVIGWKCIRRGFPDVLWMPFKLLELTCTMGTAVGVALGAVVATERFCDTLVGVANMFNDDITVRIFSPADNTIGHARLELEGFGKIELTFDTTTGDPTNANCLYALI